MGAGTALGATGETGGAWGSAVAGGIGMWSTFPQSRQLNTFPACFSFA